MKTGIKILMLLFGGFITFTLGALSARKDSGFSRYMNLKRYLEHEEMDHYLTAPLLDEHYIEDLKEIERNVLVSQ